MTTADREGIRRDVADHNRKPPPDSSASDQLVQLQTGTLRRFADWPDPSIPKVAAGVYTIWEGDRLIYVGMAGRSIGTDRKSSKPTGLWDRLRSHADGRRSGNQFCAYVCDRFVVPQLTPSQQAQIGAGTLLLDRLTRGYIRDRLAYRYVITPTPAAARRLEAQVRAGALDAGLPILNPLGEAESCAAEPLDH